MLTAEKKIFRTFWGKDEKWIRACLEKCRRESLIQRLWKKDPFLWKKDPAFHREIVSRLGWLSAPAFMKGEAARLVSFADEVRREGFRHAALLGMGGSSLAAEVFQKVFGNAKGCPRLLTLDSTDPESVRDLEKSIRLDKTLFIASSKSGGTIEVLSFFKYFFEKLSSQNGRGAGKNFVAITDPGTSLEELAKRHDFRKVFLAPADVGGRFSALIHFGLLPAALIGVDIHKLLLSAENMAARCSPETDPAENPALVLGAAMAVLAERGRDKLTLVAPPAWDSFADWIEQLVAESSGKEGKGILPVTHETSGDAVMMLRVREKTDLGGQFFLWEMATAVACALLGVNAFDEPNVQAAKDKAKAFLAKPRRISAGKPERKLETLWKNLKTEDYVALLAFLPPRGKIKKTLMNLRKRIRQRTQAVVTLGFGPRYLHSTGQLHKGGPNKGIFIFITARRSKDLAVPGEKFTFGQLEDAQALGDMEALEQKGRRWVHFVMDDLSSRSLRDVCGRIQKTTRILSHK